MRFLIDASHVVIDISFVAPGDRSHIPDSARPAYDIISEQLNRLKQTTPVRINLFRMKRLLMVFNLQPSQKRLVDDLERRISPLFDALNCETLSTPVVDQLLVLTRGIEASRFLPYIALIFFLRLSYGSTRPSSFIGNPC